MSVMKNRESVRKKWILKEDTSAEALAIVDEIAEERDDVVVGKINVDDDPELASAFGVFSIPTLVVLKDGEVANQASGARPKAQILALLEG